MELISKKMVNSVDLRLSSSSAPEDSVPLFSNTTANWSSSTFVPNADGWFYDFSSQLTGVIAYSPGYFQSYGLNAITPRHVLDVGHNGISWAIGRLVRYVKNDGTVFETTVLKWINDHPWANQGEVSDTKKQYRVDLSLYLLADPLPDWVYKAPIIGFRSTELQHSVPFNPPTVSISQGGRSGLSPSQNTPRGRKVYVESLNRIEPKTALRAPFHHGVSVGDSGSPEYLLIDNKLYLYRIHTSSDGSGALVAGNIGYINSMIKRADASAGISTGYSVKVGRLPRI